MIDTPTKKAPRGGAPSHRLRWSPPHTKDCRSGVYRSRMTCLLLRRSLRLGPGREGKEITSGRRDARGLTFSVVIPARVMQPGVSTRRKQNWHIALCNYGMTFAQRHRVHLLCVASLAHFRPFQLAVACWSASSRTCRNPVSAMLLRRPLLLGDSVAPAVLCTERMDLRTAASARQPEPCSGHPCEPPR